MDNFEDLPQATEILDKIKQTNFNAMNKQAMASIKSDIDSILDVSTKSGLMYEFRVKEVSDSRMKASEKAEKIRKLKQEYYLCDEH